MEPALEIDTSGIDLNDTILSGLDAWTGGSETRRALFKKLRDDQPVSFAAETPIEGFETGPGFWSVTRYDDIMHVSRHPEIFQSGRGFSITDLPVEIAEFYGSMLAMDAPRHTRLRRIVSKSFTPRMVARIDADVQQKARGVVAAVAEKGECDFVEEIASVLPLQIICELMGIERSDWPRVLDLTNVILGAGDPEYTPDFATLMAASLEMAALAQSVGESRLAEPRDDLVSALVHASVDGESLTTAELSSFFILLAAAGNETTRNAISHGAWLLQQHPDQRAAWMASPHTHSPAAVEEIVRFATPVIHFRRTAAEDTEIAGQPIAAGDKVVMWYESGNRDERHFDDPYRFDITRSPNDHIGFGAGGPHFCLGANLARREIRTMFEEIFSWLPDLQITSEPDYLVSPFIHGVKRMRCEFTPTTVQLQ